MLTYETVVVQVDDQLGQAKAAGKSSAVQVDIAREDEHRAPNPAEILLAAVGGCLLKNMHKLAPKMRIQIGDARVRVWGTRMDTPPRLSRISYDLEIETDAPAILVERLHHYLRAYGTVYNTLASGVELVGRIIRVDSMDSIRKERI